MKLEKGILALGFVAAVAIAAPAQAGFVDYTIRGTPIVNHPVAGQTEFITDDAGDKAALGSNDVNGHKLGSLTNIHIDRLDDTTRFTAGSGPAVAPYLNFWITDGTHFAVVGNEPSNPDFQSLYSNGYDLDFAELADKVAKIYENDDKTWLPNNGVGLTFADLANFTIAPPSAADLADLSWTGHGTGAPGTFGVNWVFGDTLSNYVSGDPGYIVANASVTAVPEPGTLVLLGSSLLGLGVIRRRRKA